ncbi:hypothetical protein ES705_20495 [subsurface metagenome]|jgi:hypothetical protein
MTLISGANLNYYTILAADTRRSCTHPLVGECHRDHDHKIAICKMGLITGSGYVDALDSVKEELLKKEIFHTDEVLNIINKSAIPKIKLLNRNDPSSIKYKTYFLISYFTSLDNKDILRLAFLHPELNYQLNIVEESIILTPGDTNEKYCEKYNKILRKGLHRCKVSNYSDKEYMVSVLTNICKNAIFFAECFYEISKISNLVSGDFDFAALLLNGLVVYGYGNSKEVKSGKLRLSIFHRSNQTRVLTPDIFKEGDIINI